MNNSNQSGDYYQSLIERVDEALETQSPNRQQQPALQSPVQSAGRPAFRGSTPPPAAAPIRSQAQFHRLSSNHSIFDQVQVIVERIFEVLATVILYLWSLVLMVINYVQNQILNKKKRAHFGRETTTPFSSFHEDEHSNSILL